MKRTILRHLGLSSACLLSLTVTLTACGDPCLDDGLGKGGECVPQNDDNGDEIGTETADETSDETADETSDETGTADQGSTDTSTDTGETETFCSDDDMDGFGDPEDCEEVPAGEDPPAGSVPQNNGEDCNDEDPNTFPGAAENDDPNACMTDADDDGWGDDMPSSPSAVPGTDCNDGSANAFPGAAPLDDPEACMQDEDGDDYGDSTVIGSTVPGTDCNDMEPLVFNCSLWCEDADMDGVGGPEDCVEVGPGEEPPQGFVESNNDCLDDNPDVYPGAAEEEPDLCTADIDDDGYGDMSSSMTYPGSEDGTDCLDSDGFAFPGAAEIDDPEACMLDADDDGWGDDNPPPGVAMGRDCDDGDSLRVVCPDAVPGCVDTMLGGSAELMATASGGDGNYTYAWTPADTLTNADTDSPSATPTDITTYTVTATDGLGNMGTDDLTVHITDKSWILGGVPEAECEAVGFLGTPSAHSFSPDGTQTCTTDNAEPTAYICPVVHEQVRITGKMGVQTTGDNDYIGFVWGWQSVDQFYLLTWRQEDQGCGTEGIVIKKIDRQEAYSINDFSCDEGTNNTAVLMSQDETTTEGWLDNREYDVEVLYDTTQTEITITDTTNDMVVTNFTVVDDTYPSGQFGTYDASQDSACNGPWQSSCL